MKKQIVFVLLCLTISCGSGTLEEQPVAPGGGGLFEGVTPSTGNPLSWENYIGHTGFNKSNVGYRWRMIVRYGRFDPTTASGYATAVSILSANHLMFGSDTGYPGANDIRSSDRENTLARFLNAQRQTEGGNIRDMVRTQALKLLEARRQAGGDYKIFWQLGNEINNKTYSETIRRWAQDFGAIYPHPNSPRGDGSGDSGTGSDHIVTSTDTGYIGYMMEYYVGPAIEALNKVNAALPEQERIVLLAGSLANSRNANNRAWLRLLMDYKFEGAYCPTLAGKRYYQTVEGITHHYLFAEYRKSPDNTMGNGGRSRQQVLLDMYRTYVDNDWPGNRLKCVYTTEEIGNRASDSGRAAYMSVIIGLSFVDFCLANGFSPDQGRVMYYGPEAKQNGNEFSSAAFSMNKLAEVIPNRILKRAEKVLAVDNDEKLEIYAFETDKDELLLAVNTPTPTSIDRPAPVSFGCIRLNVPDAAYKVVPGSVHLFSIDEYTTPQARIVAGADGCIEITFNDTDRSNGSVTFAGGKLTRLNGTIILLLKKSQL